MIDKTLNQRIAEKAHGIYEYRMANNLPGNSCSDWEEARNIIIPDRRENDGCPRGHKLVASNGKEIFCLQNGCDWRIIPKREVDKDVPDIAELKREWR